MRLPWATVTINSPNVLLEPSSTVNATGGTNTTPGLSIQGGVEQYGALNAGVIGTTGTVSIDGSYVINVSATTTINPMSILSYSGSTPLQDQGAIYMKGAALDANMIYLYGLLDSQAAGDAITGTVQMMNGTLAVDTTLHALMIGGNLLMPNGTLSLIIGGGGGNSSVAVSGAITLGNGTSRAIAPQRAVWAR